MKRELITTALALALSVGVMANEGHHHEANGAAGKAEAQTITVKGEVIDMVCYIDHNATGAKHAECARTCIKSGLPLGIKGEDGKTYLLVGEHKPMNKQLVQYAAKTITVKGKLAERDGFRMIENAEIIK